MSRSNVTWEQETVAEAPESVEAIGRPRSRSHQAGRSHTYDTRLFVAVDGSPASVRAVEYVAGFVCRHSGFRVCLIHILPPLPPELLEHGGAQHPADEPRLEADLREQQHAWISSAKKSAQRGLKEAKMILQHAGVAKGSIRAFFCEPGEARDAAASILDMARERKCRTIVVGRESASWFHESFSEELAEELLRRGKGFSIWVVE